MQVTEFNPVQVNALVGHANGYPLTMTYPFDGVEAQVVVEEQYTLVEVLAHATHVFVIKLKVYPLRQLKANTELVP